jgi:uncharacterized protein (TIGR03083 family)
MVRDLTELQLDRPVPATPGWSVRDVVSHLTGVAADVTAGCMDGAGTAAWTARQVAMRRPLAFTDVLDEWASVAPQLQLMLSDGPPGLAMRVICDIACHEHDIRGGLGRPGGRDSDVVDQACQTGVGYLDSRLRRAIAPGLRLLADGTEWIVGPGGPAATLTVEPFTLFRTLFGRRSRGQMASLAWAGDPDPYVDHLALFAPADSDLEE